MRPASILASPPPAPCCFCWLTMCRAVLALQEHLLHLMLEPRQRFSEFEELGPDEEEGGGEGACKGDDDGMLRSSHSGERVSRGPVMLGTG